jgi:hypothetical protein
MNPVLIVLLVLASATAVAQVYQRIGPDGEVHLSDQPGPDAQPIDLRPAQTVTLPPLPARGSRSAQAGEGAAKPAGEATPGYTAFTVSSPTDGEGVRANDGNVTVRLSLEPALSPGHAIWLHLDGEDGEQTQTRSSLDFPLTNLSRGRHTVEASVRDANGAVVMRAGPVTFFVLRFAGG